jgi:NTP pyrophosphatase (non-canonical NTP hydrolase)
MKWVEYVNEALKTKAFRNDEVAFTCCMYGICGEIGEYMVSVANIPDTGHNEQEVYKELGDIFWYIAILWTLLGAPRELVYHPTQVVDGETLIAQMQEKVKKIYRTKPYDEMTSDEKLALTAYLNELYTYTCSEAELWGVPVSIVWALNIEKLQDRKKRGVLHSEGNNR